MVEVVSAELVDGTIVEIYGNVISLNGDLDDLRNIVVLVNVGKGKVKTIDIGDALLMNDTINKITEHVRKERDELRVITDKLALEILKQKENNDDTIFHTHGDHSGIWGDTIVTPFPKNLEDYERRG